jgi:hypothetical protein
LLPIDSDLDLDPCLIGEEPFEWDRFIDEVGTVRSESARREGQAVYSTFDRGCGIVLKNKLSWVCIVASESDEEVSSILVVGAIGGIPNLSLV